MLPTALFTGLSVACAAVCAVAVFILVRKLERAEEIIAQFDGERRQLAILRIDMDALDLRLRRLAGTVYSPPGVRRKPPAVKGPDEPESPQADLNELDPELAAELALQTAPPVSPGAPTRR